MVTFKSNGNFDKTTKFFTSILKNTSKRNLRQFGEMGVKALQAATPVNSGKTASSWDYYITEKKGVSKIVWTNSNVNDGVNIAVILQYGHGTRQGGYVEGIDYINPAMQPVFDKIVEQAWEEVTRT